MVAAPALIGCDEFPVGYSLAGCPPAEPASASPTGDDSQQSTSPYNDFSANGNYPLNFVSQSKGALQLDSCRAGQRAVAGVRRAEGAGRNLSEFSLRAILGLKSRPTRILFLSPTS